MSPEKMVSDVFVTHGKEVFDVVANSIGSDPPGDWPVSGKK